ncbi:RDD family protein [Micropruina glycogenica]|uniref:RDD family protein n=1 Tax=Micropruina glycogenica TaxID=75385 RepID=A0A2N9JM79_9ACTN|nr:RDD family protein [Micropruina glycogenica]SPD88866.1 RDD family protein [Micropruina glycogenica]
MSTGESGQRSAQPTIWEVEDKQVTVEGLDAAGRPDPAYAEALGLLNAPLGRRALALVIDYCLWLLLQLPLWLGAMPLVFKLAAGEISQYGFMNHPSFVFSVVMASLTVALSLVLGVVQLVLHSVRGFTIGKAATGIRTVNARTLAKPGLGAILLRLLIVGAAGLVPLVGQAGFLASPLFDDRRRQGWHDKATGVWLVDVRLGLQPYDEKRMRVARKMVKAEPAPQRSALPSLATPLNPGTQPTYRPGSRISAGVLGVARPSREHTIVEPPELPPTQAGPSEPKPVVEGYVPPGPLATPAPGTAAQPPSTPEASAPPPAATQPATAATQHVVATGPVAAAQPQRIPPHPPLPPPTGCALRLDTGELISLATPVVLGRNPDPQGHPGARAVPVADDSRSLSKTHLLVRPVAGGLEITDCHSTNGSGLVRDGVEYGVTPGVPVRVVLGDTVRLGDRTAVVIPA